MILNSTLINSPQPNPVNNRLKIAIEVQRVFRPHKHGMDVVARELLNRLPLVEDDIDYHVMVKRDSDRCINTTKNRIVHMLKKAPYFIWEQYLLPKACKKIEVDALHCTCNTAPLNSKVPLILTLHDVIFLEQNNFKSQASLYQRLGNVYRKLLVSRIAKKAVKVITVSAFQKNLIVEKLGIPAEKIEVIHNGVGSQFFDKINNVSLNTTLGRYGLKRGYIFFMANTEPRKNTEGVLNAYAKLLVLNSFSPRLLMKGINAAQLNQLLKQENLLWLKGYIDLLDYIPQHHLPAIYQGASMLWFPSFSEGFGLPIIEAMASGTPVVTSSISCMPEIAGDAALLVDPHKPNEIATAAYQILNLPMLAFKLSKAGQRRAANFSWEATTQKTVAVYHEMKKAV